MNSTITSIIEGKEKLLDLVLRTFAVFNGFDGPGSDSLFWRTDEEYAPLALSANCNDLFFWGCSDGEDITTDNIHILEQSYADMQAAGIAAGEKHYNAGNAHLLFCARVRGMRPQGAYYKYFDPYEAELFNACGPERETGFGNPLTPEKAAEPVVKQNPKKWWKLW